MTLAERFAGRMGRLLGPEFPEHIALAVSGGGDSMAMLALAHDWARPMGVRLWVVTVDHGLRPESAAEAAMVAAECAVLGHPHATLRWHWDGQGNLQDAARRARLSLIDRWRGGIGRVLFAHTQDDVAETFLMRLARGSGVEGLSAMAETRLVRLPEGDRLPLVPADVSATAAAPSGAGAGGPGFHVIRPLLRENRADLRHHVETLKVPFVDDPSNDDPGYDRVRARRALSDLGIDAATLAATARRMGRAREALDLRAADIARTCVTEDRCADRPTGDLLIDRDAFADVERDTQLRLLAAALQWAASAEYRPRAAALEDLLDRALAGGGGTLHGARVIVTPSRLRVCREYEAVKAVCAPWRGATVWDRRWSVASTLPGELSLRALGPDGWQQLDAKPDNGPPHDAAIALPALFDGARLIACALSMPPPQFEASLRPPRGSFAASLLSR